MVVLPKKRRFSPITNIESLEVRALLTAITAANLPAAIPEAGPNDTVDQADDLGASGTAVVDGSIDRNGVDVDWYSFTLEASAEVNLEATSGTLGLYNRPNFSPLDQLSPRGNRLLMQSSATDTVNAQITRKLTAGTYFIAVSGTGNSYFNPFLGDSGLAGAAGDYTLVLTSAALRESAEGDVAVLAVDSSPLDVRIDFDAALSFSAAVELIDAGGNAIPLRWTNFNSAINELQLAPKRALAAGDYTVVVKDTTGTVRLSVPVQVTENAGMSPDIGDDTPATAIELGDLEGSELVQIPGIIGDDLYYDFGSVDPAQRPGNDVDLYHFQIASASAVGLQAEVFAGRFGSNLDVGVSLYRVDSVTGHLEFVVGNNHLYNRVEATNLTYPLFTDSLIGVGLESGDYYLAVSYGQNTPSPMEFQIPGTGSGIFNPEESHSGSVGWDVGPYVLNVRLVEVSEAPKVTSVSIAEGSTLPSAPTSLTIQFDQFVNAAMLANANANSGPQFGVAGISIQDGSGHVYVPRLVAFDPVTFTAQFQMADRLPSGSYQLRIDGSGGLANVSGVTLADGPSNVVHFSLATPAAGAAGNPTVWTHDPETDSLQAVQSVGVLFRNELQSGVAFVRAAGSGSNRNNDQTDAYGFEILEKGKYQFLLSGARLSEGIALEISDIQGNVIDAAIGAGGLVASAQLGAGRYVVRIGNWPASQARGIEYQLEFRLFRHQDDPLPLFSGPAPAIGIRLVTVKDSGNSGGSGSGGIGGGSTGSGGSGGGRSGGGISNLGGSAEFTRLVDSPNDYNTSRVGLPRLNLPSNLDNLVIAIPTISSDLGSGLGNRLQVARSLRRISGSGEGLVPGRLAEFADGPMGRARRDPSDLTSNLATVRKLSRLIDSALLADRDSNDTQQAHPVSSSSPHSETTVASDQEANSFQPVELAPATGPVDGEAEQTDSNHTTGIEPQQSRLSAKAGSFNLLNDVFDYRSQTANDLVFMPSDLDRDALTDFDAGETHSAHLPDSVFAAGLSLLVASTALPRRPQSGLLKSHDNELYLTSTRGLTTSRKKFR